MKNRKKGAFVILGLLVILLGAYSLWAILRPFNPLVPVVITPTAPQIASKLVWPKAGQSAVGVLGSNIIDTNSVQTPMPTASTAKIITALMVLKAKPLSLGQQGPVITLGPSDVAIYNSYVARQGSVVPVQAGEQISEYGMLEAMLLPSANNMADSLAIWAYGSLADYTAAANTYLLNTLGLKNTTVGSDASGFMPNTVSTAQDLVKIGEFAMDNPVIAQIVNQKTATGIPLEAEIKNVNVLLGMDGIIGLKTGNTDQAGGVFVGAAKTVVGGQTETLITANMDAPTLGVALAASLPLVSSAETNFTQAELVQAGTVVGKYFVPWQNRYVSAITSTPLSAYVWAGSTLKINQVKLNSVSRYCPQNSEVGYIEAAGSDIFGTSRVGLILSEAIDRPSVWWRLTHP